MGKISEWQVIASRIVMTARLLPELTRVGESGAIRYTFWSCTYIWKTSARICIKFRHNLATYVAEVHETFHCPSSSYVCGRDETPRQCFMGLVENVGVSWNTYLSHVKVGVCINVPQQYFNKPQWCINMPRSREIGLSTQIRNLVKMRLDAA